MTPPLVHAKPLFVAIAWRARSRDPIVTCMLLPIHIAAGGAAVILGYTALFTKKGGTVHRRSGMLFVYAMLVMGVSASILEFMKSAQATNVVAALMSIYLCGTALTTVRRPSKWTRIINIAALTMVISLALLCVIGGVKAINTPGLSSGRVPFRTIGVMSFILATVLSLAAAGDVRVMLRGLPAGGARIKRHLWRMCFALFIAAGSFFSIRERVAKILPQPLTTGWMRALPILILFGAMFFYLAKRRKSLPLTAQG